MNVYWVRLKRRTLFIAYGTDRTTSTHQRAKYQPIDPLAVGEKRKNQACWRHWK